MFLLLGYSRCDAGSWAFYSSTAIPSGAVGSIFGFLGVARVIWHLAVSLLNVPACHYFDDFPHFEIEPLATSSQLAFETLLRWKFADGDKNLPFATSSTF